MKVTTVYGAAGTGKTTFVTKELLNKLNDDEIRNVVALSFTRAAKTALLNKEERLKSNQVRTLHSICFERLELTSDNLLTDDIISEFMDYLDLPYQPNAVIDDELEAQEEYLGNLYLKWYGKLLNEAPRFLKSNGKIDLTAFVARYKDALIELAPKRWIQFVKDFNYLQDELKKYSYEAILYKAWKKNIKIDGSYLILDEAQDLSPLMYEIIKANMENFDEVWILGDDDQTIYTALNGAEAEFLLDYPADKRIILEKSWRLPKRIWLLALKYIRMNHRRVDKDFTHRDDLGMLTKIHWLDDQLLKDEKKTFILCRHKKGVWFVRQLLEKKDIPYSILGAKNKNKPYNEKLVSALKAYDMIRYNENERPVSTVMWDNLLHFLKDEIVHYIFGEPKECLIGSLIFDKYAKELIEEYPKLREVFTRFAPSSIMSEKTTTVEKWYRRIHNFKGWAEPKITIGTIHQSKGLEADRVILFTAMNARTYLQMKTEYERRVWYVGVTRAREELYLWVPGKGKFNEELVMLSSFIF